MSIQMLLASQKVLSSFSKDPACYLYACANQMQKSLTRYWWQPQLADSNVHISSMARFSPQLHLHIGHPDLTVAVSSPRVSLGMRPFILGAINFICQQYHVMFCTCANKLR